MMRPARGMMEDRPWGIWLAALVCGFVALCAAASPVAWYLLVPERDAGGTATFVSLAVALASGALAWGLARDRAWTRPALMACALVPSAASLPHLGGWGPEALAVMTICLGPPLAAFLYLYRAPAVVRYYARLHDRAAG